MCGWGQAFCGERQEHQEIGEELFIRPRTVTTHVSNILNKINVANRVQAATYAARQGLA